MHISKAFIGRCGENFTLRQTLLNCAIGRKKATWKVKISLRLHRHFCSQPLACATHSGLPGICQGTECRGPWWRMAVSFRITWEV